VASPYGHDGFLIESAEVGALVREARSSSLSRQAAPSLRFVSMDGPPA